MSSTVNLTNSDAAYIVAMGIDGKWQVTVVVKATYAWDQRRQVTLTEPAPLVAMDEFAGDPASSGLLRASDLGPLKPRLDVLLAGALAFPRPMTTIDVHLAVGSRLRKKARVFGDRAWLPSAVAGLVPSQPRPVSAVAIAHDQGQDGTVSSMFVDLSFESIFQPTPPVEPEPEAPDDDESK